MDLVIQKEKSSRSRQETTPRDSEAVAASLMSTMLGLKKRGGKYDAQKDSEDPTKMITTSDNLFALKQQDSMSLNSNTKKDETPRYSTKLPKEEKSTLKRKSVLRNNASKPASKNFSPIQVQKFVMPKHINHRIPAAVLQQESVQLSAKQSSKQPIPSSKNSTSRPAAQKLLKYQSQKYLSRIVMKPESTARSLVQNNKLPQRADLKRKSHAMASHQGSVNSEDDL